MTKEKLLSGKLKELRKLHNYTQDYVAGILGVVRQTYSHYESGRRTPDASVIYKLAGLYEMSVDDLMQITVDIDRDIYYDAPKPTQSGDDLSKFIEYSQNPDIIRKFNGLNTSEKKLLYYFDNISQEDKDELLEIAKMKSNKKSNSR